LRAFLFLPIAGAEKHELFAALGDTPKFLNFQKQQREDATVSQAVD